jgi:hypothetical protein
MVSKMLSASPERKKLAEVLKRHIQGAFEELDLDYDVTVDSVYEADCVRIAVVVKGEIP